MARKKSKSAMIVDQRKSEEMLGVLLSILGVLVLIALFTHQPGETPKNAQVGHVKNGLGIAGVYISHFLIQGTIGYPVLALPFLIIAWGINRFLGKSTSDLVRWTFFVILIALYVSMSFSLHTLILADGDAGLSNFSGVFSIWGAKLLQMLFGSYGAMVVLIGLIIMTVLLFTTFSFAEMVQLVSGVVLRSVYAVKKTVSHKWKSLTQKSDVKPGRLERDWRGAKDEPVVSRFEPVTPPRPEPTQPAPQPDPFDEGPPPAKPKPPSEPELDFDEADEDLDELVTEEEKPYEYSPPPLDLLQYPDRTESEQDTDEETLRKNAHVLEESLANFGIRAKVLEIHPGPVITRYELQPAPGIKVSRIVSLADDLAMTMRAKRIRIVAPIPGKAAVGIEIPNLSPDIVYLREILGSPGFQENSSPLTLALGKTASGRPFTADLSKMPHLLVAGSTGSGKSVCLNTIIASILCKASPTEVQFVLIDPKRLELSTYSSLYRHHLQYVAGTKEKVATTTRSAIAVLKSVEQEMERRYELLAAGGVRNIEEFNQRVRENKIATENNKKVRQLNYLVIIVDELADLMLTSSAAKDVEEPIARLTQMSRAVGIHLIVATQRPSVDVITGVIKANFPARIAFQVASKVDSRTILDMNGAEKLLGRGDMLFLPPASPEPVRIHNSFITLDEIEKIIDHILHLDRYNKAPLPAYSEEEAVQRNGGTSGDRDALFWDALKLVVRTQQGSVSLLQRKLKVGYSRAARIVDELEDAGIVGPFEGSKARQVLMTPEELEEMEHGNQNDV